MFSITVGQTNITNYIKKGGVEWSRNDIDSSNSGRAVSGLMIRSRIATKDKLKITCRPLLSSELSILLTAIEPQTVNVTFTNPRTNTLVTKQMYCSTVPVGFLLNKGGNDLWEGISFNLIEL